MYILKRTTKDSKETTVNILDVTSVLKAAQQALAELLNHDLQYHPFDHIRCDSGKRLEDYKNIHDLAKMSYGDPEFSFPVRSVELWNGDQETSTDYIHYEITKQRL